MPIRLSVGLSTTEKKEGIPSSNIDPKININHHKNHISLNPSHTKATQMNPSAMMVGTTPSGGGGSAMVGARSWQPPQWYRRLVWHLALMPMAKEVEADATAG
jgi:hypothetical protein